MNIPVYLCALVEGVVERRNDKAGNRRRYDGEEDLVGYGGEQNVVHMERQGLEAEFLGKRNGKIVQPRWARAQEDVHTEHLGGMWKGTAEEEEEEEEEEERNRRAPGFRDLCTR